MRLSLIGASITSMLWAAWTGLWPSHVCRSIGMPIPMYPEIWQCLGLSSAVWGIAYAIAAFKPLLHWPIVLVGLLAKVAHVGGFLYAFENERVTAALGWSIVANDLIWILPFGLILFAAYRNTIGRKRVTCPNVQRLALRARTNFGATLDELSHTSPLMVVFLRHLGCTFCRETLADLSKSRAAIESTGVRIVVVHMTAEESAGPFFARYGLAHLHRVSDPQRSIYKAFGLGRGGIWELFGPRTWWRGIQAGILARHGVGTMEGDGFQMPGVFMIFHGEILRSYIHQSAADRPNYLQLAAGDFVNTESVS